MPRGGSVAGGMATSVGQATPMSAHHWLSRKVGVLLAIFMIISAASARGALFVDAAAKPPPIMMSTDPRAFPSIVLGTAFDFDVIVMTSKIRGGALHLNLVAGCPTDGIATLSGDVLTSGNACVVGGQARETGSVPIPYPHGQFTFHFTVVYSGAPGAYTWTIEAHRIA